MVTLPWWGYLAGIVVGIGLGGWGILSNAKKKKKDKD